MNKNVTIITPIYNRSYAIEKLYNSLLNQTQKNFEWLVVDDGSSDNIRSIIDSYIKEGNIEIKYIYQENGGKHRALNNGISKIETPLTFIVDSDDYLKSNAIEIINKYFEKYKDNENLCGMSFLRCYPDGKINGPKYPKDEFISDYIKCRLNKNIWGDKAEVFFTKKLKEFPFLEVPGEKFLVESYVWVKLAMKYDMVFINLDIYIGEYLEDGLTQNRKIVKVKSPIGVVEKSKVLCNKKSNFKVKCKAMIFYIAYGKFAQIKLKKLFKEINYKGLFLVMLPLGYMYKIKISLDIRKKSNI